MSIRVEVRILDRPFTFVGEDEERIRAVARYVDEKIGETVQNHGIVNTMNAVIMAVMEIADEYLQVRKQAESFDGRTLRLLKKVEEIGVPCDARDKW